MQYQVDFTAALPLDLPTSGLPKLTAFYANRSATAAPRRGKRRTKRR